MLAIPQILSRAKLGIINKKELSWLILKKKYLSKKFNLANKNIILQLRRHKKWQRTVLFHFDLTGTG